MPVHPTDHSAEIDTAAAQGPTEDMIARASRDRIELSESDLDLDNRRMSQSAARNAVLPTVQPASMAVPVSQDSRSELRHHIYRAE